MSRGWAAEGEEVWRPAPFLLLPGLTVASTFKTPRLFPKLGNRPGTWGPWTSHRPSGGAPSLYALARALAQNHPLQPSDPQALQASWSSPRLGITPFSGASGHSWDLTSSLAVLLPEPPSSPVL